MTFAVWVLLAVAEVLTLDRKGARGEVRFDHTAHVKASTKTPCVSCHHTRTERGTPQLAPCAACHLAEGDPKNPASKTSFDELHRTRAFHDQCIGCHITAVKGPRACVECHATERKP